MDPHNPYQGRPGCLGPDGRQGGGRGGLPNQPGLDDGPLDHLCSPLERRLHSSIPCKLSPPSQQHIPPVSVINCAFSNLQLPPFLFSPPISDHTQGQAKQPAFHLLL